MSFPRVKMVTKILEKWEGLTMVWSWKVVQFLDSLSERGKRRWISRVSRVYKFNYDLKDTPKLIDVSFLKFGLGLGFLHFHSKNGISQSSFIICVWIWTTACESIDWKHETQKIQIALKKKIKVTFTTTLSTTKGEDCQCQNIKPKGWISHSFFVGKNSIEIKYHKGRRRCTRWRLQLRKLVKRTITVKREYNC